MITCAIVDDEPLAVSLLQSYVQRTPVLQLAGTYHNAIEALAGLQHEPVDLLFLDIQMPEWNGLDFARVIDTSRTCIIFTTAFSQYAPDGYKVNAVDYLLKPIAYTDFASAVARAQKHLAEHARPVDSDALSCSPQTQPDIDSIFVKSDYKQLRIRFSDILYIEGLKDYVKIYLVQQPRPVLSLISMRSLEEKLPSHIFCRVHRSFIVNMERIEVVERGQIVFGQKHVPVSDSYRERFQHYLDEHSI